MQPKPTKIVPERRLVPGRRLLAKGRQGRRTIWVANGVLDFFFDRWAWTALGGLDGGPT
jgi:hypothetical protein